MAVSRNGVPLDEPRAMRATTGRAIIPKIAM